MKVPGSKWPTAGCGVQSVGPAALSMLRLHWMCQETTRLVIC